MNLEEALALYDKAKDQGLVGNWPKALIVVVEELKQTQYELGILEKVAKEYGL